MAEAEELTASGVDGETTKEFEANLEERVLDTWQRMKGKQYKAPPVRRVEIPRGNGKTRPAWYSHGGGPLGTMSMPG